MKNVLTQGDTEGGGIGRAQLAAVLVRSLLSSEAVSKTFELASTLGEAPSDWATLFAPLAADRPQSLDGAMDRSQVPLEREPGRVILDVSAARERALARVNA